ncbi:MAG: YaeQ family protein [Burkholderiales bacterium]|nr:YaeQ family protein [Burkholderiales bacterium]MDE2453982.1 YaeQ family protein [Burkholderiales bacterium]
MALKSTVHKAALQIADMDRALYADHALTVALHPSETEERMMVRVLAFALQVPADDARGALQFARGLSDADAPDLWQHDLTGQLVHWIEVGQPDERRLAKACARAERVTLYAYSAAVPVWWSGIENKLTRLRNLQVWQVPAAESQALAALVGRSMQLQITVQDGQVWVADSTRSVEVTPRLLHGEERRSAYS